MNTLSVGLALVCQFLEPQPTVGEVHQEVRVTVRDAENAPIPGIAVTARMVSGEEVRIGTSDANGTVSFVPEETCHYELRAELPGPSANGAAANGAVAPGAGRGVRLITPFTVLAPPRRWLFVLLCAPVGVVLLWWNLRHAAWRRGAS